MRIVKIEKPNCMPCQMVDHYFLSQDLSVEKINIEENLDLAVKYQVMSVPVTLLLTDEGSEVLRVRGFEPEQLDELVTQYQLRR